MTAGPKRDAWIGELFDAEVWTASCPIVTEQDDLLPEERALVANAVPKRRHEFAAGRRCARSLLSQLGHPHFALLRNDDRTPRWPAGLVGSISHSDTLCVVALARSSHAAALGVDVEPDAALEAPLWPKICSKRELDGALGSLPDAERGRVVRLLFSAKEATYKAVYPLVHKVFGFRAVEIQVDWEARRFTARLDEAIAAPLPMGHAPSGAFSQRGGFVFTAATIRAS